MGGLTALDITSRLAKTNGVNLPGRPTRQESRARVLEALRNAGVPQGISAVADATGLSAGAIRFHLANLLKAGAVGQVRPPEHDRPGRPAVLYEALQGDADNPAAAYRMLAALLGCRLIRAGQPSAASDTGRSRARANCPNSVVEQSQVAAFAIVAQYFRGGLDLTMCDDGRTLVLRGCQFHDLATEQSEIICSVQNGRTVRTTVKAGITTGVQLVSVPDGCCPCLLRRGEVRPPPALSIPAPSAEEITL